MLERGNLGRTGIFVSPVALGCWPMSGMTSPDVNDADSRDAIAACFDVGINFLDTAFCYGADGESERLIGAALKNRRDEMVIATKGGIHWDSTGQRVFDARPATLRRELEKSLRRLNTDRVELLYLHAPDPNISVTESAEGLKALLDEGKALAIGVSNLNLEQLGQFHAICPISAFQPPYNMLQREIERDTLPWCREHGVSVMVYWPLMKGLLAGKLARDHVFPDGDGRQKYPMFQGDEWHKNQDFVDDVRGIAESIEKTVADLVISWTIRQPGITAALCGAKRADQIRETATAMTWRMDDVTNARIQKAIKRRGVAKTRSPV